MKRGTQTNERRIKDRRIQGSVASALPWVLTFAALGLLLLAAAARAEDLNDLAALQKTKIVIKADRAVDRNSL